MQKRGSGLTTLRMFFRTNVTMPSSHPHVAYSHPVEVMATSFVTVMGQSTWQLWVDLHGNYGVCVAVTRCTWQPSIGLSIKHIE